MVIYHLVCVVVLDITIYIYMYTVQAQLILFQFCNIVPVLIYYSDRHHILFVRIIQHRTSWQALDEVVWSRPCVPGEILRCSVIPWFMPSNLHGEIIYNLTLPTCNYRFCKLFYDCYQIIVYALIDYNMWSRCKMYKICKHWHCCRTGTNTPFHGRLHWHNTHSF